MLEESVNRGAMPRLSIFHPMERRPKRFSHLEKLASPSGGRDRCWENVTRTISPTKNSPRRKPGHRSSRATYVVTWVECRLRPKIEQSNSRCCSQRWRFSTQLKATLNRPSRQMCERVLIAPRSIPPFRHLSSGGSENLQLQPRIFFPHLMHRKPIDQSSKSKSSSRNSSKTPASMFGELSILAGSG